MTLKQAFFILRHGSAEGNHKYLEAVKVIEDEYNRQKAEIERLTINMNAFGLGMKREKERADNARAEAVKEFAERLNKEFAQCQREYRAVLNSDGACAMIIARTVTNNLVKEFTEERHESQCEKSDSREKD